MKNEEKRSTIMFELPDNYRGYENVNAYYLAYQYMDDDEQTKALAKIYTMLHLPLTNEPRN